MWTCSVRKVDMSRRQVSSTRRGGNFPFVGALNSKSKSSPLLSVGLVVLVCFISTDHLSFSTIYVLVSILCGVAISVTDLECGH